MLQTTNTDGSISTHTSKISLSKSLAKVYKYHYQLNKKIFMTKPLVNFYGNTGITSFTSPVLTGTFTYSSPNNLDLQNFLQAVQRHQSLHSDTLLIPNFITPCNFEQTFSTTTENKAAPPSNQHYGIYKAMATNLYLYNIGAGMLFIPYMTGYTSNRWKIACALVVSKKHGSLDSKDTRAIILQDGDMNAGHQIFVCRLQHSAHWFRKPPQE